jgi:tRNA uridine 5-carboxymethylaminomethyl modification enzyme
METGHVLGLIDKNTLKDVRERKKQITKEIKRIKQTVIKPAHDINDYLLNCGTKPISNGISLDQLLKRAELDYHIVEELAKSSDDLSKEVSRQVEIEIKYEGYINKQLREIDRAKDLERVKIPECFDFTSVHGLSNELKEKLSEIKPTSLGQASRIDGITPAGLSALMISMKASGKYKTNNP